MEKLLRWHLLLKVLLCIRYLGRQGLALRGHEESIESFDGNLYQLLLLEATRDEKMKAWLDKKQYLSPVITNEMINIMGLAVLEKILTNIKTSKWYAIIVDEATDISHTEQMSLSIRWVNEKYQISEDTLGLVELPNTKALTIYQQVKDILIRCSLPLSQCRGQAYDGASNMSGIRNGVQALVKQEESKALYVHCLAHNLNLCLQDASKKCKILRNTLDFINDLIQLIKFSPKRLTIFENLRREVNFNSEEITSSLRVLCPTRWTVRHASISSILKNYKVLQSTLEEVQEGHDEYAAKAHGLFNKMELFETYFGLEFASLLFGPAEQFSTNIQAKDITVQEAVRGARFLVSHLKSLRTETMYNRFYEQTLNGSQPLTEQPKLPRNRKLPKRLDSGSLAHQYQSARDLYRHAYYEALDLISEEVTRRFEQEDLFIIKEIEVLMIKHANGNFKDTIPEDINNFLNDDVDLSRLQIQLCMLPDLIKTAFNNSVKEVTNIRTIADAMLKSEVYQKMLTEIDKLLLLYFTFPVTTSTAERSFSTLRRIKTYLRSTMNACRLNNLLLLHIHRSKTDALDLEIIARKFISINSRRENYFGKFS